LPPSTETSSVSPTASSAGSRSSSLPTAASTSSRMRSSRSYASNLRGRGSSIPTRSRTSSMRSSERGRRFSPEAMVPEIEFCLLFRPGSIRDWSEGGREKSRRAYRGLHRRHAAPPGGIIVTSPFYAIGKDYNPYDDKKSRDDLPRLDGRRRHWSGAGPRRRQRQTPGRLRSILATGRSQRPGSPKHAGKNNGTDAGPYHVERHPAVSG